jgi:hypothetical protein
MVGIHCKNFTKTDAHNHALQRDSNTEYQFPVLFSLSLWSYYYPTNHGGSLGTTTTTTKKKISHQTHLRSNGIKPTLPRETENPLKSQSGTYI